MRWADARATAALIVVTMAASALIFLAGALPYWTVEAGFIPARIGQIAPGLWLPWVLTPLSATLVHGGWTHLLFNLVMLGYCGRETERVLGAPGVLVLYGVGAYAAALGQWAVGPASMAPMIGASGAISALVGAYALLFSERRAEAWGPLSAGLVHVLWLAAAWIGVQLLIGATGAVGAPVAIAAHIGGFLAGLALARPLLIWRWRGA